jgi:hypothetical protein
LLRKVQDHYQANQFPVPENLWDLVLEHMCPRLPPGFCEALAPVPRSPVKVLSLITVRAASEDLVRISGDLAPLRIAEIQAETCKSCPANKAVSCPSCSGLPAFSRKLVGGRRVMSEASLGICACLGAYLPVVVHCLAPKLVNNRYTRDSRPEACWIPKE